MTGLRATLTREYILASRNRVGLALGFAPPLVFLLLFTTSISNLMPQISYDGQQIAYSDFILPAIMLMSMLAGASTTATALFQEQQAGMILELWSYPLRRTSYVLGKLGATTALVFLQGIVLLGGAWLLFRPAWPADRVGTLLLATICTAFAFNALYLFASTFFRQMQTFMIVINIGLSVLLFASPSFYPQEQMPVLLQAIAGLNPATYGIRALRDGLVFGLGRGLATILLLAGVSVILLALTSRSLTRRFADL